MKNYLSITLSLFVLTACAGSKYDVVQDKDADTSCFEVEHEMDKLKNKDGKKATARFEALEALHKQKNCD